jgi:AcrR family transcriptional regulator
VNKQLQEKERKARRTRITRAAVTVFAERGVEKASIEQVAREADLSVGAIYLYFRSKEDLLGAIFAQDLTAYGVVRNSPIIAAGLALMLRPNVRKQLSDETVAALSEAWNSLEDKSAAATCLAGLFYEAMEGLNESGS